MFIVLGMILALSGVALLVNGGLAASGRLKRNHYFLARRPAAMQSRDGWPAALEAAGPTMRWAGAVSVVAGIAVMLLSPDDTKALAMVGLALLGTLVLASIGGLRAQRAAVLATRNSDYPSA